MPLYLLFVSAPKFPGTIVIKEENNSSYEYSGAGDFVQSHGLKVEQTDAHMSSIKVLDVTSISLKEMEQLSHGHSTLLENPLSIMRRGLRRLQEPLLLPEAEEGKGELPRPSNAVATVLAEQEQDEEEDEVDNVGLSQSEQQLLMPQKVMDVSDLKKKRGRPRKGCSITQNVIVNGLVKKKRGRPRKYNTMNVRSGPPIFRSFQLIKKPDTHYFRDEILMTRLRNKRL
jgi:hypothetical protein